MTAWLIAACAFNAASVLAQERVWPTEQGLWSATFENDSWAGGKDRHYTHGTRLTYLSTHPPQWLLNAARRVPCVPCRNAVAVEYVFGQNMFTPADTWRNDLIVEDRPYAGWLYAGAHLLAPRETAHANRVAYEAIELDIGIVGPGSLAEQTQTLVHELLDVEAPRGWKHQLNNEPGALLRYTRRWQQLPRQLVGGLEVDVSSQVVGALGNVYTYMGGAATLRFGRNLQNDLGSALGPSSFSLPAGNAGSRRAWYLFSALETRAVARNIFLDGNTFSDSHSVEKKPLVWELWVGLVFQARGFRITFAKVARSKEFENQDKQDEYGAVMFSFWPSNRH